MPPWLPEAGYGDFQDKRSLTAEQIRMITNWVQAGAPEGDPKAAPAVPHFPQGWQLGRPDLVLTAPKPFLVPASGSDVFWNFIFNPQLSGSKYVRGVEIHPGTSASVHHANLLVDRAGSFRRFESGPGSGFPGMDVTVSRSPLDPDSHFLFWKPGSTPAFEPDGLSWRLDPGNLLVLNTHFQPTGKPELVQPSIGIYFTNIAPTKHPIIFELENDNALNIAPGDHDFVIADNFRLPVDVDVLAIYPHAHYLGKLLEAYATFPDGSRKWLIRIPDWNLDWQAVYRYREPVFLPKGSVISMRFHYDNSAQNVRNPNSPPKRVLAGNNASDEMGHLWLQVLPRGPGDHRRELQEALARHKLDKNPQDYSAHVNLGAILMTRLDAQGAEHEFAEAVRIDDSRPEAHDMLGVALRSLGQLQKALDQFRAAIKADPAFIDARYNLALSLAQMGDYAAAVENFRLVASAYPNVDRIQKEFSELRDRSHAQPRAQ